MLKNKVAVITGSARGIGKAIAIALAKEGANVVISDINLSLAQATAEEIKKTGSNAIALELNVAKSSAVDDFYNEVISSFGQIDILVNNAGITKDTLMMRMKEEDWDQVIDINLKGVFNCTKTAIKYMLKQKSGSIVNIASVVGITGNIGQANYSASKGGVIALTKTIAREVASRGIRANAIAPGFITSDMTNKLSDDMKKNIVKNIPFGKMGDPEDIANAVVFLSTDKASYITGQVLCVDGGMVM